MYQLKRREPEYFEFKVEGRDEVYRMIAVDSLSQDDIDDYMDAADKGTRALNRWARALFERECPGSTQGLAGAEFTDLMEAWRDRTDLGE